MISWAQNAEDVVLARALDYSPGCYVDVGAGDPTRASVTRHFFEQGWRGLNIDPRPEAIADLDRERPSDLNLAIAIGDHNGEIAVNRALDDLDLSTTDAERAKELAAEGHQLSVARVPVRTLDDVLTENGVGQIDFLKIDVEGAERAVLAGARLEHWRPRVIVIEAVRAWSSQRVDSEWRELLEGAGYLEACFDGINLFFVRAEDEALIPQLAPASALDDFVPAGVQLLHDEISRLRDYTAHLDQELLRRTEALQEAAEYARHLEADLAPAGPSDSLASHAPAAPAVPPRLARVAVIGSPRMGNTWVRRVLADALGARELPVHHPADLDWTALPHRAVVQLHWYPTELLLQLLDEQGFVVVSPARHPLDTLLSVLTFAQREPNTANWLQGRGGDEQSLRGADPSSPEFLSWATSDRARRLLDVSPRWWQRPRTVRVRYEELVSDPQAGFAQLLAGTDQPVTELLAPAVAANTASRLSELSGGVHVWQGRSGLHEQVLATDLRQQLIEAHQSTFTALGYSTDPGAPLTAAEAEQGWTRLR